jgi:hypothetical protein
MSEQRLVQADGARRPQRGRGPLILVAVLVLAAIAVGAWWFLAGNQTGSDWERLPQVDLAAPAGPAFSPDSPWMRMQLAPARPGTTNTFHVSLGAPRVTPVPERMSATVSALLVQPLSGNPTPPQQLPVQSGPDGALVATAPLDRAGWWRVRIDVEDARQPSEFFLLLPDPNVNGPGAVPRSDASTEGEAVFQRGLQSFHDLKSLRYTQWLADGSGHDTVAEHAVGVSADGTPGFTFRVTGGMEAVVIGTTRWIRFPGLTTWEEQESPPPVPLADWGEEYNGATGFTLLGDETIDGEPCSLLAFVVPEQTEPRRQTAAWYLWWVGQETGHVRQEAMVSRVHYMKNHFTDFDAPLVIAPPPQPATPPAATPAL